LPGLTSSGTDKSHGNTSLEDVSKQQIEDSNLMIRLRKKIKNNEKLPSLSLKKSIIFTEDSNEKNHNNKIAKFKMTKFVSEERMRPLIQNPSPFSIVIPTANEPSFNHRKRSTNETQQILPKNTLFTTIYQRLNENEYSRIK
jgi:hypothetical protein